MRKTFFLFLLLFCDKETAIAQIPEPLVIREVVVGDRNFIYYYFQHNGIGLTFDRVLESKEPHAMKWQKQWVGGISNAVAKLPPNPRVVDSITVIFYVDTSSVYRGWTKPWLDEIHINLMPFAFFTNRKEWEACCIFTVRDPTFGINGIKRDFFTDDEVEFVVLHEIGHIYGTWKKATYTKFKKAKEVSPTLYGQVDGRHEDFADTFALYILWPSYLKQYFPLHHEAMKTIFLEKEFQDFYSNSPYIQNRLTVGPPRPRRKP